MLLLTHHSNLQHAACLQAAKRLEEQQALKRNAEYREREKAEAARAREKIRVKLGAHIPTKKQIGKHAAGCVHVMLLSPLFVLKNPEPTRNDCIMWCHLPGSTLQYHQFEAQHVHLTCAAEDRRSDSRSYSWTYLLSHTSPYLTSCPDAQHITCSGGQAGAAAEAMAARGAIS